MDSQSRNSSHGNRLINSIKNSITTRLIFICFLSLIMLIPLNMVEDLIHERKHRQNGVVSEISEKWGEQVLIYGPILKIPYRVYHEKKLINSSGDNNIEKIEEIKYLYNFPLQLEIKSSIDPELKKRGIFETAVYKSKSRLSGSYDLESMESEAVSAEDILWDKAQFVFKTSNLRGINEQISIHAAGKTYNFNSKYQSQQKLIDGPVMHLMESTNLKDIDVSEQELLKFDMDLSIKGSSEISFVPVGKTTTAIISSPWKTKSFTGDFLPQNSEKLNEGGFKASWKVLDINRPFPQMFFKSLPDLNEYAFGVNFMIPVDEYQKSERATKYGILVIGLTFLIFFLIQTLSKIAIHPFQYLMIGLGLVMFYTLLISISEHSSFLTAYLIAGVAIVIMISLYSRSILKGWKFPLFIAISLLALHTFIYIIIQLESYALLVGSIGLFIILGAVMYVSRKIDWQNH